jgi:hypothetical protein
MTPLKSITTLGEPIPEDKQTLVDGMLAHHENEIEETSGNCIQGAMAP